MLRTPAHTQPKSRWLTVATAAATLVLAACGAQGSDPGGESDAPEEQASTPAAATTGAGANADGAPADLVPAEVRERGYVDVAGDATYPPIGFMDTDGTTILGSDHDFGEALGEVLELEFRFESVPFESIIPGLEAGRYDIGMSWFNVTEERMAKVDYVYYGRDGSSFLVPADSEVAPQTLDDLCGLRVAVQTGSVQADDVVEQQTKCEDAGEPSIDVSTFPDQTEANLALDSGRADVSIADTPVAAWQVTESDGRFELSGEPYGLVYHGIIVPKGDPMAEPIAHAMAELFEDGTYTAILEEWGMGDAAIEEVQFNGDPIGEPS